MSDQETTEMTTAKPEQARQAVKLRSQYESDRAALAQFYRDLIASATDDEKLHNLYQEHG
jgi:hypothetical protein